MMQGEAQPDIAAHGFGGEMGQPIPDAQPQAPQGNPMTSPIVQRLMEQLGMGGGPPPQGVPGGGGGPALGIKQGSCGCPVVTRQTRTVRMPSVAPKDNKTASTTDMAKNKDVKGATPVVV
jgi:hypothetical protein